MESRPFSMQVNNLSSKLNKFASKNGVNNGIPIPEQGSIFKVRFRTLVALSGEP
jgi:hypothetical protein